MLLMILLYFYLIKHLADYPFLSIAGFNTFGFLTMVLTAYNAISLMSNNNNNNNDNNNNNNNDNNNNNVNINEGNNKGEIEDPNNMVNLPAAPGGRRIRLARSLIKQNKTSAEADCRHKEAQQLLSSIVLDVVKLLSTIEKICLHDDSMIAFHCLPQLFCEMNKRRREVSRALFPHYYCSYNRENKGTKGNGKNTRKWDANQNGILLLEIVAIGIVQACGNDTNSGSKLLLQRLLRWSMEMDIDVKCNSFSKYKCVFQDFS